MNTKKLKMKNWSLGLTLALVSPSAVFAHGSLIDMVKDATSTAIEQFKIDDPHAAHIFTGIKEAKASGATLVVKFTVNTSARVVEYGCVMDHSTPVEKMVCTKK